MLWMLETWLCFECWKLGYALSAGDLVMLLSSKNLVML